MFVREVYIPQMCLHHVVFLDLVHLFVRLLLPSVDHATLVVLRLRNIREFSLINVLHLNIVDFILPSGEYLELSYLFLR